MPLVNPEIICGDETESVEKLFHVEPASVEYWYFVRVLPVLVPAVKAMLSCPTPGVIAVMAGAPGANSGVTELDAAEGAESPAALVAVTVNVYEMVRANPVTVQVEVGYVAEHVNPPTLEVTR